MPHRWRRGRRGHRISWMTHARIDCCQAVGWSPNQLWRVGRQARAGPGFVSYAALDIGDDAGRGAVEPTTRRQCRSPPVKVSSNSPCGAIAPRPVYVWCAGRVRGDGRPDLPR
jgi:hypothetical protein